MFSEKELENQAFDIRKNLLLVFIPIVIMILIIFFYQSNSLKHNKEKYLNSRKDSFSGKIIKKYQEGDYPRAARFVLLEDYHQEDVNYIIYYRINIGDSVYKKKDSDSVYFCLKSGEILIEDYNKSLRDKYYELLNNR